MSGLSNIQDTTSYQNFPIGRKKALDAVEIKVRSAGSIIGHSYLRSSRMRPIDVMYKESLYSNTPRIGVQEPSLPDLRYKRQSGGRSAVQHGNGVTFKKVIKTGYMGEHDDMTGGTVKKMPKKATPKSVEEAKKTLRIWLKIYDQMSPEEKKVVKKQHDGVKKTLKMMKHMPEDALIKLRNSKTMKWLREKQQEMRGGALCGGSLWSDIKKGVKKVGKTVVNTGKKIGKTIKKGVKETGKFVSKVGEKTAEIAEKTAEIAGKVGSVVATAAEVATVVTAVIPGLEEFTPILATVAAAAEGVEKLGKEVAKHSKTAKDVGKKMSGGKLSRPTISSSITRSTRGDDRVMFNALHPLNYKKAIL